MTDLTKLCPTCSQPCEHKDGIMCKTYVCYKKDLAAGKIPANNNAAFKDLFSFFSGFGAGSNPNPGNFNNQYNK